MTLKPILIVLCLAVVAACTEFDAGEARCKCFGPDGTPTGNCKFTPVAGAPTQLNFLSDNTHTSRKACGRA